MLTLLFACTPEPPAHESPDAEGSPQDSLPPLITTPPQVERARWTIAVWMDGDNNLERYIDDDINELERAKVDGIHIAVQVDRAEGYSQGGGDWTDTRRYEISADDESDIASPIVEELGEVDMGDGMALSEFLLWTEARYPADHFALVLWNHGGGFWIASDDSSPGSRIYLHDGELKGALDALIEARGDKIDLVAFDACNMGEWEVAATLQSQVKVMTASQAWVGGEGYAYDTALPSLSPSADAFELGDALAYSAGVTNNELTHAAVDLSRVPELSGAIDTLAQALLQSPEGLETFARARSETQGLDLQWDDFWLDLGGFADHAAKSDLQEIASAAEDVRAALDASLISNYRTEALSFASGLTIMAQTDRPSWFERYAMGPWSETHWNELLEAVSEAEQGL